MGTLRQYGVSAAKEAELTEAVGGAAAVRRVKSLPIFWLTLWSNLSGSKGCFVRFTCDGFAAHVNATVAPEKTKLPLFSGGRFGPQRTPNGSLRSSGNLIECTAIVGDHDAGTVTPGEAANRLHAAGVAGIIYTTPSHAPGKPRWRVVALLRRPRSAAEYAAHVRRLDRILGGSALAPESRTPAQGWYYGRIMGQPAPEVLIVPEGRCLDEVESDTGAGRAEAADPVDRLTSPLGLEAPSEVVASAVRAIPNNARDWELWNRIGMLVYAATGGTEEGLILWCEWSGKNPAHDEATCRARWEHFKISPPTEAGAGTLFHIAGKHDWRDPREPAAPETFGDVSNSRRVAKRFVKCGIIHVEGRGWHQRQGATFRPIPKSVVIEHGKSEADALVRETLARIVSSDSSAAAQRDHNEALKVHRQAPRVRAMVDLAATAPRVSAQPEEFDTVPGVVATPGGVWLLAEGRMREPLPSDRFIRCTAVVPQAHALVLERDAPHFARFLREFTGSDAAVAAFLARWAGYALSGTAREHKALFLIGPGGNGRGVLLNTLAEILGTYSAAVESATFTERAHDRHSEDVDALRGARFVSAQEIPAGAKWSQQRVTMLVSTDRITARGLYRERSDFVPTFAITFAANSKPRMPHVDNAVRRRLLILECGFSPPCPDPLLPEKLRTEGSAILRWALDGARGWYRDGLVIPEVITSASAEYFDEEDITKAFVAERLEEGPRYAATYADLKVAFASWALLRGQRDTASAHDVIGALKARGFQPVKDALGIRGRGLKGVRLKEDAGL